MRKKIEFDFKTKAIKVYDTVTDTRDQARFHVKLIMGTTYATIEDTKFAPVFRTMVLDLEKDEVITEENFSQIFADVCEALVGTGNMADDELAACVTYPEGTTITTVPLPDGVH